MGSISLRRVGVLTPRPLFENLSLVIGGTDRVGLVAANGGGKTTLLRCLAGLAEPTTGDIVFSRGLRVAYVEQEMPDKLRTLPLAEAIRRALPPADRDANEWRVGVVLDALGAPAELHDRPVGDLSGGWQRLALVARAWVTEPDALLLDEPTNHLDLEKIQRLERWIAEEAGPIPIVIASHDRQLPGRLHDANAVPASRPLSKLQPPVQHRPRFACRRRSGRGTETGEGHARGRPAAAQCG